MTRGRVVASMVALGAAGIGVWAYSDSDDARQGRREPPAPVVERPPHLDVTGEPLFVHGDLYLDGRSHWFVERFDASIDRLLAAEAPEAPAIDVRIHAEPFTSGPWVEALDPATAETRRADETGALECRLLFRVEGVGPDRLLHFLACSGFKEEMGDEGEYGHDVFCAPIAEPPACVDAVPPLAENEFLTHETWRGMIGADPTDLVFRNRLLTAGDVRALRYELWADCGPEDASGVRLAAGQVAVRPVSGGSLVELLSFYRGQEIVSWLRSLAIAQSRRFYLAYADTIREAAPRWRPTDEAKRFAASVLGR